VARTTKKQRAKQLKHDKFRDTTLNYADRIAHRAEGRGRTILYLLGAVVAAGILFFVYSWWSEGRSEAARLALGKAIEVADAPVVTGTPLPNQTGPTFPSERERAQKAVEEFQKVQQNHGSPYKELARYMAAVNLVTVDRPKGLAELEALTKDGNAEVAAHAKFALAQAREADGQLDAAAALYQELAQDKGKTVAENTLNLRLASVYEKQGKRDAAVELLFKMVEASRKAKDKDGKPLTETAVTRAASERLQTLSPERYKQLPPEPAPAVPPAL
jgi:predicted negative regulator of RcsB-dependent stress response